ncbi:hypothetical protein Droror1_Dr00020394 [Drosera rotundifolia]
MNSEEVLKVVFPQLDGKDLASCMLVSKQWRDVAQDDYLWKCLCAKRWPSICKRPQPPTMNFYNLYRTFYKRRPRQALLPPRLSLDSLDFYIDIWSEENLIFSEVVPGPFLKSGLKIPAEDISDMLRYHLESSSYKMTLAVEPRFSIPIGQTVSVSVLVARKDSNKVACILDKALFDYIDRTSYRALAFNYLDFSPKHPFISGIRAWISLLFMDDGNEGVIDVFGIEMDFCDAASSEDEVLWLLDMLDWK